MPTIAYMWPHGANDFPLHFSFFEQMNKLGVLDRFDFLLNTSIDPYYCAQLVRRYPQLKLLTDESRPRRWMSTIQKYIGRGSRPFAYLDKFDAVCVSPGGGITGVFQHSNIFRLYPRTKRRGVPHLILAYDLWFA